MKLTSSDLDLDLDFELAQRADSIASRFSQTSTASVKLVFGRSCKLLSQVLQITVAPEMGGTRLEEEEITAATVEYFTSDAYYIRTEALHREGIFPLDSTGNSHLPRTAGLGDLSAKRDDKGTPLLAEIWRHLFILHPLRTLFSGFYHPITASTGEFCIVHEARKETLQFHMPI